MFLKRRNLIAWILLMAAAISWVLGQNVVVRNYPVGVTEATEATVFPPKDDYDIESSESDTEPSTVEWPEETIPVTNLQAYSNSGKAIGFILSFLAVLLIALAIFFLKQKTPFMGPDFAFILIAAANWWLYYWENSDYIYFYGSAEEFRIVVFRIAAVFLILTAVRELWGWLTAKMPFSWCLVHRLSIRFTKPQITLLVFVAWFLLGIGILLLVLNTGLILSAVFAAASAAFGLLCLWKYGSDLNHFKSQLNNYEAGQPITVQKGAFSATEQQLLEVQAQHEEAIKTAVISERFRVELISNVSHDLRTPLTSILGYGELLEKEKLSPEGQEQLTRLNQKAGYMRDIVESLFELTKVSSGASESRKDEIDLIRLLEQTIGLFDDQVTEAGFAVRRHYESDSIIVVTDGARMHQVFANLLTNAIKYALPGTRIHLEVTERAQSIRVRMVNTASYDMDFTPEEIVQRFVRGDKARSTKGSGLGLAIAQTYTESVGGSFHVTIDGDQFSAIVELPKS